jgi:hypothetical protein
LPFKALELGSKIVNSDGSTNMDNDEDKNEIKRDFDLFSKESKSLENKCKRTLLIPKDFNAQLSERSMIDACNMNENGGFV